MANALLKPNPTIPERFTLVCLAFVQESSDVNIVEKLKGLGKSFEAGGYEASFLIAKGPGWFRSWLQSWQIVRLRPDVVVIRNNIYLPTLLFHTITARLLGSKIVIEIPTPLRVMIQEIWQRERSSLKKMVMTGFIYAGYPLSLLPAHRLLHYSDESPYFTAFSGKKVRQVTNGINTASIPVAALPKRENFSDSVRFLAVAMFQSAHGYDRMIRSLHFYLESCKNPVPLHFTLIGEGSLRQEWERMSRELGVDTHVTFTGKLIGRELDEQFNHADIAVGSLTPFRNELHTASELKLREYCARGVPFIYTTEDQDFPDGLPFLYKAENSDSLLQLNDILSWYHSLDHKTIRNTMRTYAEKKLDYKNKELLFFS